MIEGYLAQAVRDAEAPYLATGVPLMERAAFALANIAVQQLRMAGGIAGARVVVLAGRGNNGADGILAAARLARRGAQVTVILVFGSAPQFAIDRAKASGVQVIADLSDGGSDTASTASDQLPASDQVPASSQQAVFSQQTAFVQQLATADLVLDAMIGTGSDARPTLRSPARELVSITKQQWTVSKRRPLMIAVDQPSGVDATTGEVAAPDSVLPADMTVTFGAMKAGLLCDPAAAFAGRVVTVDIGIDAELRQHQPGVRRLELSDLRDLGLVAPPKRDSHKYTRGVLGVLAGSERFPGAGVLTTGGALRTGLGMVRFLGSATLRGLVLNRYPEVVTQPGRVQAYAAGSGVPAIMSDDSAYNDETPATDAVHGGTEVSGHAGADIEATRGAEVRAHVIEGLRLGTPMVLDAGALGAIGHSVGSDFADDDIVDELPPSVVLAPHAGELVLLMKSRGVTTDRASVESAPLYWARRAHEVTGATVLLKGPTTIVVGPSVTYSQADAPSWLATAGAGDVLTGIIGALLASHHQRCRDEPDFPALIAAAGAMIHGLAAQYATQWVPGSAGPVTASDVIDRIPHVIAEILR